VSVGCPARLRRSAVPRGDRLGERACSCGKEGSVDKGVLMLEQLDRLVWSFDERKARSFGVDVFDELMFFDKIMVFDEVIVFYEWMVFDGIDELMV
jgi:hypothetical protein